MMQYARELLMEAQERLLRADHLAFTTYPQLQEPKLLALILENTCAVFLNCMNALLHYERMYKRVSPNRGDFNKELAVLRTHCFRRYGIPDRVAHVISEVRYLADKKESCAMEFRRHDQYVLCSDGYQMDSLNIKKVRGYISEAEKFLNRTLEVVR